MGAFYQAIILDPRKSLPQNMQLRSNGRRFVFDINLVSRDVLNKFLTFNRA
jgi:hypothetical protein